MFPVVQFFGLQIPTFFFTLSLISVLILVLIRYRSRRWYGQFSWLPEDFIHIVWSLTLVILVSGFLGGRLGHVLIEEPSFYLSQPQRIFAIRSGGFVFFGGFILGLVCVCAYMFWKKLEHPEVYFDFFTPLISLSYLLGRWGCFLNGCCYGKVCDWPWALSIPDAQGLLYPRHPTQLYSIGWELILFLFLWIWQRPRVFYLFKPESVRLKKMGNLFIVWLFFHSLGRFIIEFWRDDFRGPEWILTPSGWISLGLMTISLFFFWRRSKMSL